ncbi:sensor domain-containing diguanylate cyclase [Amphritea balenae]|uniref:diguanylate cyclase n=1 Tax=Amphritea balenae TaxID=452629 RepID=A0A3P1STR4_9GAMM|nr:sensor domain-containing diguanylate cyclase [Amphritea balenae]RRD00592.1 sensor domain-containing diguanylate cyclase [Amphritea balenae]GGK69509.1 hypothetical protein GCM10007941_19610 [Amphritea balenae]
MTSVFSEGFYKAIFDGCSDAIYVIDPQSSRILDGNTRAWQDLGLSREQLLQHSVVSLQNDVENLEHWQQISAQILLNDSFTFIGRHCHQNGAFFPVEVYTSVIELDGQKVFISIARNLDLTLSQREEFRTRDARLTYALNEAVDGLWDWNIASGEVFFSPQLKRMLKYLPHEMEPSVETWVESLHENDRERVLRLIDDHLSGRIAAYEAEYRLRNRMGEYIWVRDRGRVCERDEQGKSTRVVGMLHDISQSKKLEEKLRQQASHDHLTGLLNRRAGYIHFKKQLSYAQRYEQQFTLCLIDLDHFKSINDTHGHLAGDIALKHFVSLLSDSVRQSDTLMRWGGEEFLLLLPKTDAQSAKLLIEQLKDKVQASPVSLDGREYSYTFSAGLASFPGHSMDMDGLINSADDALYSAKASGRNLVMISYNCSDIEQAELF